jgi:hypothetical protein
LSPFTILRWHGLTQGWVRSLFQLVASGTPNDLTAEERVLLRLARQDLREEDARLLRAQSGIDWDKVAGLALRGGIAGLVKSNLRQLGIRDVPRPLAVASLRTEAENRMLLRETIAVCTQASALGALLLPLKGIALVASGLYSHPSFRSMCDVDLLCQQDRFEQVLGMLRDRGFVQTEYFAAQRAFYHHVGLVKAVGNRQLMFELHWQPTHGFYAYSEVVAGWFSRSGRASTPDGELPSLSPTDLLLSVGLHLATHRFRNALKWLVDIAEISRRWQAEIDWRQLWGDARRLGAANALTFGFRMAVRLLDAPINGLPSPGLRERLGRRLSPDTALVRSEPQPDNLSRGLIHFLLYDDSRDGIRLLMHKTAEIAERRHINLRFLRWSRQRIADKDEKS